MQKVTKVAEVRNDVPSVLFCWGNMSHGQLGLGGIEDEQICEPRELAALSDKHVSDVACGVYHTIFLLKSGVVYSCGNNDCGQLGHDKARRRPGMFINVALVYNLIISDVRIGLWIHLYFLINFVFPHCVIEFSFFL